MLPVEFSCCLLYRAAFIDIGRRMFLVVPQLFCSKRLEFLSFDWRDDAAALICLAGEMSNWCADNEPPGCCRFHDGQLSGFADRARHHGIDGSVEIRHVVE